MAIGVAANCQATFASLMGMGTAKGNLISEALSWGVATGLGIWASGGISGGHLNPAITLAFSVHRGFPVRRIPSYIFAQILGSYVASLCVYGVYRHLITLSDPSLSTKSAGGFVTAPIAAIVEPATVGIRISTFWNEVLGSALLMISALAVGDAHNTPPPEGMGPMVLLWTIIGLLCSFSLLDGAALNPARDLGPRVSLHPGAVPALADSRAACIVHGRVWTERSVDIGWPVLAVVCNLGTYRWNNAWSNDV